MKLIYPITFFVDRFIRLHRYSREKKLTDYVNPFLGTATLWEPEDLGYVRTWKIAPGEPRSFQALHYPMQWCS